MPSTHELTDHINFLRSDHARFWYSNETDYQMSLRSLLFTDTGIAHLHSHSRVASKNRTFTNILVHPLYLHNYHPELTRNFFRVLPYFFLSELGINYLQAKYKGISKIMRKWPYLIPWASNQKTKGTFFSPTLKVEEKKVPLFFLFEAQGRRYGHFLIIFEIPLYFACK